MNGFVIFTSLTADTSYMQRLESTVRNKMATVYFTTIPREQNTANRHIESHIFREIRPFTNNIVYTSFKVLRTFPAERF